MLNIILKRTFIATDCEGKSFYIRDMPQLIQDYGVRRFFLTFGFSHGKVVSKENIAFNGYLRYFSHSYERYACRCETKNIVSEFAYIITDVHGRHYSPDYLFGLWAELYPAKAEMALAQRPRFRLQQIKSTRRTYTKENVRILKQNEWLKEEGVKEIRNIQSQKVFDYWDNYSYELNRSWKRHRKTQYKHK